MVSFGQWATKMALLAGLGAVIGKGFYGLTLVDESPGNVDIRRVSFLYDVQFSRQEGERDRMTINAVDTPLLYIEDKDKDGLADRVFLQGTYYNRLDPETKGLFAHVDPLYRKWQDMLDVEHTLHRLELERVYRRTHPEDAFK